MRDCLGRSGAGVRGNRGAAVRAGAAAPSRGHGAADPDTRNLLLAPASYLIGMDGGSEDGDLPGICIACSECGQVIFSGTLAPGAEATVEIPQSCPRCSVTGGCGDE